MAEQNQDNEPLPLSNVIEVLKNNRVYKTAKWWMEGVSGVMFGKRKVFVFLWINDGKSGKKWKRKNKLTIGSKQNWEDIKKAVDPLVEETFG